MTRDRALSALLLAGGNSTRMGEPKALLDLRGKPLWRRQVEKLQALQPAELFISLPRQLSLPSGPWRILYDEEPGLGPLAGLYAAFQAMTTDWLVVLAVDLPEMTSAFLERLVEEIQKDGCGRIPQVDIFYQGLAAIYPRSIGDLCRQQLAGTDRSLQHFIRQGIAKGLLRIHPVKEESRFLFHNVNRPADLEPPGPRRCKG